MVDHAEISNGVRVIFIAIKHPAFCRIVINICPSDFLFRSEVCLCFFPQLAHWYGACCLPFDIHGLLAANFCYFFAEDVNAPGSGNNKNNDSRSQPQPKMYFANKCFQHDCKFQEPLPLPSTKEREPRRSFIYYIFQITNFSVALASPSFRRVRGGFFPSPNWGGWGGLFSKTYNSYST